MVGIYKITSLIDGKIYIGQSTDVKRRFKEHLEKGQSVVSKEILKEGRENFLFEILEECLKSELNRRELFYFEKFKPFPPIGYNEKPGTERDYFDKRGNLSSKTINSIIEDLLEGISIPKITEKYNLNRMTAYRINNGESYIQDGFSYPIQVLSKPLKECPICGERMPSVKSFCSLGCAALGQQRVNRPSREGLKKEIRENTFVALGKKYGVSDNAIKKWCKAENLPFLKKEIKDYSDEEWRTI